MAKRTSLREDRHACRRIANGGRLRRGPVNDQKCDREENEEKKSQNTGREGNHSV